MEGYLTERQRACSGNITCLYWKLTEAIPCFYIFSRCPEFPLSPLGFLGDGNQSNQLNGHKPSLKIINSFTGIHLYSEWCTVIPSTATHRGSRTLIQSLVFNSWRANSIYREILEFTHSIELLNKEENWHSRINFNLLGLQSSPNVCIFHMNGQNNTAKVNIYCAMLWRALKQKSLN